VAFRIRRPLAQLLYVDEESDVSTATSRKGPEGPVLASSEVCQLVTQGAALEPLTPLEHFLRNAKRKARGMLRRLGLVPTHPLDAEHAPPWRRPGTPPDAMSSAPDGAVPAGGTAESPSGSETGARARGATGRRGRLQAGDLVRVKPLEEIMQTLDGTNRLKGLKFLNPMAEHCGKTYRVLKPVRRIVNDMDHTVKKARGIVILDGVVCHGKGIYGREDCDRTCFFFWKEEWLTRIEESGGRG